MKDLSVLKIQYRDAVSAKEKAFQKKKAADEATKIAERLEQHADRDYEVASVRVNRLEEMVSRAASNKALKDLKKGSKKRKKVVP